MPGSAVSTDHGTQHATGGTLIPLADVVERALALSTADACFVIGRRHVSANVRWANNTVTTNGVSEEASLSVISVVGRRVAAVTRTYFPEEHLEAIVRESEAACARVPEAPDFMPLIGGSGRSDDWNAPPATTGIHAFGDFVPRLGSMLIRARHAETQTFGYAEHNAATVWLASSSGLRRRHADLIGRVDITAKTPDFSRSTWAGTTAEDLDAVDPGALFDTLQQRLAWCERRVALPAGHYDVLLEPSCTADLAISAYSFMTRRDADEGRSPYSRPGGGTLIGERLFGRATMYSDPAEPDIPVAPFHAGVTSSGAVSVFDNGMTLARTDWVRDGELRALLTPRYWAARLGGAEPVPYIDNLVVTGNGPTMERMIAETKRALLVTCLWYVRTVDPQTALQTGLTRDGVFLVEDGRVAGEVNNFRWNMSPIASLAQATEIGRSERALPRQNYGFPRVKAPPVRVERFNMSSVSEAS